jgi:hypothetical protein
MPAICAPQRRQASSGASAKAAEPCSEFRSGLRPLVSIELSDWSRLTMLRCRSLVQYRVHCPRSIVCAVAAAALAR